MKACIQKIFIIAISFFIGCASLQSLIKPPSVKVEGLDLRNVSFDQATLDFTLLVTNPNAVGITLDGYNYELLIEENSFLQGDEKQQANIAANGQSNFSVPITIDFDNIYNLYNNVKNLDYLSYKLTGNISPGGLLTGYKVPFNASGKVPNIKIPKISIKTLSIDRLNLSGIDLNLAIDIQNPNVFGFNINNFNYNISLSGTPFASGQTEKFGEIPKNDTGTIHLPLSVNFGDAVSSLRTVLMSKSKTLINIRGNADLNTTFGSFNLPFNIEDTVAILR
jgi:LEA14-like dessication related protein